MDITCAEDEFHDCSMKYDKATFVEISDDSVIFTRMITPINELNNHENLREYFDDHS